MGFPIYPVPNTAKLSTAKWKNRLDVAHLVRTQRFEQPSSMKRASLVLCVIVFALSGLSSAKKCPTTAVPNQSRSGMKHKKPPTGIRASRVTVEEMIDWPDPKDITIAKVREAHRPIDARETKAFELRGDVWRFVMEANDCDYHLEVSEPGGRSADDRVIVEIPNNQFASTARRTFESELAKMRTEKLVSADKFKEPIVVKGMAFFDGAHFSTKHPKVGFKHGTKQVQTLWELHPVFELSASH